MTTPPSASPPVTFRYQFRFSDGRQQDITIPLDPHTLQLMRASRASLPDWTALSHHKCAGCPLADTEGARCPAAVSVVDVVDLFSGAVSFELVDVTIQSDARTYAKRAPLQQAVSSLIGLLMVTSGCPVMGKLRPMVRFHLPFATLEETQYRVISMYLLAQFFLATRGRAPDWQLRQLPRVYEAIRQVNKQFAKRLSEVGRGDAHLNALVILDSFADSISFTVDERLLQELEGLFGPYLE